ncbi:RHS repeat-associated core domain-containing protein, partial [Candidatus Amarobacter glycogenicus]|uniref:RHS repeat-associated core domain-containing protein n=1 Tax=Candidatus Amarobacter glycogenicus TaxID=3140699 RepID=UPI0031CCC7FD
CHRLELEPPRIRMMMRAGLTSTTLPSGTGIVSSYVDGLGSTMAVVDSSGNSQKSYTYDVYGEATPSGGLSNEFDFAGQQTDGTGLQYLRARYYDPGRGTFRTAIRWLPANLD